MKETGRQAAIFEGAQSSYVWLNYLKTVHLRSLFGMLETIAFELDRDILDPSHNQSSAPVITRSHWLESATTSPESFPERPMVHIPLDSPRNVPTTGRNPPLARGDTGHSKPGYKISNQEKR